MNSNTISIFYENIRDAKKSKKAYFYKNFINPVPDWDSFMNCVFQEMQSKDIKWFDYNENAGEFPIGNVIVVEQQYFAPQTSDYKKYFPEIIEFIERICVFFNDKSFSISPHIIPVSVIIFNIRYNFSI